MYNKRVDLSCICLRSQVDGIFVLKGEPKHLYENICPSWINSIESGARLGGNYKRTVSGGKKALSIRTLRKKLSFVEFCCENFWTLMAA